MSHGRQADGLLGRVLRTRQLPAGLVLTAPESAQENIPGRYSVMYPANADAATESGEARYRRPGPERPL